MNSVSRCAEALYCPGCGFGFWHNWGVLVGMQPQHRRIYAVSGSALAVACYLCRLRVEDQLVHCDGMRRRLMYAPKSTLRSWLHAALPDKCVTRCRRLHILVRAVPSGRVVVLDWRTKDELIECLLASVSVLSVHRYRGAYYTDCMRSATHRRHAMLPSKSVYWMPTMQKAREDYREGILIASKYPR